MQKTITVVLFTVCVLFFSCKKKFLYTKTICSNKIFVEVYEVNPFGVDEEILTDSTNFRMSIGDRDDVNENFKYECNGDSILITKINFGNKNCHWDTLSTGYRRMICDTVIIEKKALSLKTL